MVLPLGSVVFSLASFSKSAPPSSCLMIASRLFLGLHQDVPRLDLVDRRRVGHLLVVAGADLRVGDLCADILVDQFAVQRALLQERHAALEVGVLVEALRRAPSPQAGGFR